MEFVSGLYASNHNPFFDFLHRDSDDDFIIATVRSYIDEAKKQGLIRKEVDTDESLLRIAAASTGLLFYWCVFNGKIDLEYEVDAAIATYLRSIAIDPDTVIGLEPLETQGAFLK